MSLSSSIALFIALAPFAADSRPVHIAIQVIEAEKHGNFDPALDPLKKAIVGYEGAKLVDTVEADVPAGASVQLQILKTRMLKVTVKSAEEGAVKLEVGIPDFKFQAETVHKKGKATVIVAHPTGPEKALFLAVTPKL